MQKDSRFLVRVPETLRDEFKAYAESQNRTMSELIRAYAERAAQKAKKNA